MKVKKIFKKVAFFFGPVSFSTASPSTPTQTAFCSTLHIKKMEYEFLSEILKLDELLSDVTFENGIRGERRKMLHTNGNVFGDV